MREMVLRIEKFNQKFQEEMIDLWNKCNLITPQNDPAEDIKRKLEFQPKLFFVGLLDEKVVGSIMAGYEGHRGWINYLAVAPEHQRQGYGRQLVQRATEELKRIGCPKINLQVRRSNTGAIDFYKHLGFKEDNVVSLGMRLEKSRDA